MIRAIDLFAGCGGTTTGAQQTDLIDVVWAANHWALAVKTHADNHPGVMHACQDLQQANFVNVPDFDLLLASPACQGHSKARGAEKAHHDGQRATAWAVVTAADVRRPRAIVVENVPEFRAWGLYPHWHAALRSLGYNITEQVLNAAEWGVPQNRERLFIVCHKGPAIHLLSPRLPMIPARSIVDFTAGRWLPIHGRKRPLVAKTLARIAAGRAAFGDQFLIAYYGSERGGRSLDRPLGTIGTVDTFAVINGAIMRMMSVNEYRLAMGFPEGYILPTNHRDAVKVLGNAVPPPMARGVLTQVAGHMAA